MGKKIHHTIKALRQLPKSQLARYALYQFQKRIGLFSITTPSQSRNEHLPPELLIPLKASIFPADITGQLSADHKQAVVYAADKIITGKIPIYGLLEQDLDFPRHENLAHWSVKSGQARGLDIKDIWGPARFMWAVTLAQAFLLTGENTYAKFFYAKFEEFLQNNPYNHGPNWESAQEVGLRLTALVICASAFSTYSQVDTDRIQMLLRSIADHADRILPTLSYAIAQNNNHLLSEAAALYTAGTFLPDHPRAKRWKRLGAQWFSRGLSRQILDDGQYVQYSNNYHRMMLMLALWMNRMYSHSIENFTSSNLKLLRQATNWLFHELDIFFGCVPNYGHNDGSFILPFSTSAYEDFRPVIQAASLAFLGCPSLPPGDWDDLAVWMGVPNVKKQTVAHAGPRGASHSRIGNQESWGILRAGVFSSRPAHADQLHVDLWFKGQNIVLDPGTYRYNQPPPWENALSRTKVHNTITINNADQMTRAGKFLWLDWAQAKILKHNDREISALHSGYDHLGLRHIRTLSQESAGRWKIADEITQLNSRKDKKPTEISLHWLFPDGDRQISSDSIALTCEKIKITIMIENGSQNVIKKCSLVRAGKNISDGDFSDALLGWVSPTYGVKKPAISLVYKTNREIPVELTTTISVTSIT